MVDEDAEAPGGDTSATQTKNLAAFRQIVAASDLLLGSTAQRRAQMRFLVRSTLQLTEELAATKKQIAQVEQRLHGELQRQTEAIVKALQQAKP